MTKQTEAMKLALEALSGVADWVNVRTKEHPWDQFQRVAPAITALREALAEQPAQQEIDWKDQYEKQKRRADMWVAKYEADIGPLEKAGPVTAQQEPVAVVSGYYGGQCVILPIDPARIFNSNTALYTSPPPCPTCEALARTVMLDQTSHDTRRKGQGLTDEQIWREYRFLWPFHPEEERKLASDILEFARAIEAAHGIKENT